jgi:hypothetical protein
MLPLEASCIVVLLFGTEDLWAINLPDEVFFHDSGR